LGLNPEVNLQVSSTSKLSIAHLKRNRHLVIAVKLFMEAFSTMSAELNIVSHDSTEHRTQGQ